MVDFHRIKKGDIIIVLKQGVKSEELKKGLVEAVKGKSELVTSKAQKVTLEIRSMDEGISPLKIVMIKNNPIHYKTSIKLIGDTL